MATIEWADFERVEIRIGTVVAAEPFPEALKPAYRLRVDFGAELGEKKSSAQITDLYECEALVGRQVLAVVNFRSKQIGPMRSECLVLGFPQASGAVVLAQPERPVPDGTRMS